MTSTHYLSFKLCHISLAIFSIELAAKIDLTTNPLVDLKEFQYNPSDKGNERICPVELNRAYLSGVLVSLILSFFHSLSHALIHSQIIITILCLHYVLKKNNNNQA